MGRSQVVRQRILIPPFGGSSPPAPASQSGLHELTYGYRSNVAAVGESRCYGNGVNFPHTATHTHIPHLVTTVVLMIAAFLGGALNSLAGGGTLVTFPALLFAGLSPIDANASSVVALFSGTFAGAWAYRRNIIAVAEFSVLSLFALSLVGGLIGALLLLWTPTTIFASLVPWLILFATIVFAVGNFAPVDAIQRVQPGPRSALVALFIIAIYGGYFGGGIGFLMLAAFTLFGMRDINAMNGLKMGL